MNSFDFGQNWLKYSQVLDEDRIHQAIMGLQQITQRANLSGLRVLDLGCGSGIHSISASRLGAEVTCADVNPKCLEATRANYMKFSPAMLPPDDRRLCFSILDTEYIRAMKPFDLVYAWGVLHHTGDMKKASINAAALVKPGGDLAIAIYNRHWSSPLWKVEKWIYVHSPRFLKVILDCVFFIFILLAKLLFLRKNPFVRRRGMSFMVDVVDWIGGYPYEYASMAEVQKYFQKNGFELVWSKPAPVPTGCNEFLFRKR